MNAKTRKHFLAGIKTKEEIGWDVQTMPSSLILGYRFHSLKNKVGQLLWPSSFPFGMFFIRLRYPCRSRSLANSSLGGTVGGSCGGEPWRTCHSHKSDGGSCCVKPSQALSVHCPPFKCFCTGLNVWLSVTGEQVKSNKTTPTQHNESFRIGAGVFQGKVHTFSLNAFNSAVDRITSHNVWL